MCCSCLKEIGSLLKQCFKLRIVDKDKICPALSTLSRRNKPSWEVNKLDQNIVILIHTTYATNYTLLLCLMAAIKSFC